MYKKNCRRKWNNHKFFHIQSQNRSKFHHFVKFDYICVLNNVYGEKRHSTAHNRLWITTTNLTKTSTKPMLQKR